MLVLWLAGTAWAMRHVGKLILMNKANIAFAYIMEQQPAKTMDVPEQPSSSQNHTEAITQKPTLEEMRKMRQQQKARNLAGSRAQTQTVLAEIERLAVVQGMILAVWTAIMCVTAAFLLGGGFDGCDRGGGDAGLAPVVSLGDFAGDGVYRVRRVCDGLVGRISTAGCQRCHTGLDRADHLCRGDCRGAAVHSQNQHGLACQDQLRQIRIERDPAGLPLNKKRNHEDTKNNKQ